ncbi:MAG: bifunctional glutamate N-acetyltransferase/amino-acid acetyltransferase ArgJ [Vicinamibacterales bacterium]
MNATSITAVSGGVTAPDGYQASAVACGLKPSGLDLAMIVSDQLASAAGIFTTNRAVAAPVVISKNQLSLSNGKAKAIVVNSKCANACTGDDGIRAAKAMVEEAATSLSCELQHVLIASTGVIGMRLDTQKVSSGIRNAAKHLQSEKHLQAAEAIMTTDVSPKEYAVSVETSEGVFTIGGMAKGAGMIEPNMATMLGFLTTDAAVEPTVLNQVLREVANRTFNTITIDGESSTNDTVFFLANGSSGIKIPKTENADLYKAFVLGLDSVCSWLAREIVRGGEGATKLATVTVTGAASDQEAQQAARLIANSPLVKTALHGEDPNWGRIVAVAGRSGVDFDQAKTEVRIGSTTLFANATVMAEQEPVAAAHLAGDEVKLSIDLGTGGSGTAKMWTCDFSPEYVHINADYRT